MEIGKKLSKKNREKSGLSHSHYWDCIRTWIYSLICLMFVSVV